MWVCIYDSNVVYKAVPNGNWLFKCPDENCFLTNIYTGRISVFDDAYTVLILFSSRNSIKKNEDLTLYAFRCNDIVFNDKHTSFSGSAKM